MLLLQDGVNNNTIVDCTISKMASVLKTLGILATFVAVVFCNCPKGWKRSSDKCFFLSKDKESFAAALQMCEIIGRQYGRVASLATVTDDNTSAFLKAFMISANVTGAFIGANDIVNEGTFVWVATGKTVTYTNWGPEQPNNRNGIEQCTAIRNAPQDGFLYTWTDDPCTIKEKYFCEMVTADIGILG